MHTQHNFCTQQLRYVGIARIAILFGLNFVRKKSGKLLSGGPESGPVWGWSISLTAHVLALLWEPN